MDDADAIRRALQVEADDLRRALLAEIAGNLSGDVLQERTGALKASIVDDLAIDEESLTVTIASEGVPYAAIQEHGGTTSPHDIVPVKARALAFAGAGGLVLARRVHHPGSRIPARPFLGSALDASRDDIVLGLKDAVLLALGAA